MAKKNVHKTEAVVLSTHNLGETSRIADLYSQDWGRFSAVAKMARGSRSRFGASLEIFTHIHLVFYLAEGRGLSFISQIETLNHFGRIRQDPSKIACGCYLIELVKVLVRRGLPDRRLFRLILESLAWLEDGEVNRLFTYTLNLKMMKVLGFGPEVDVCVKCREGLNEIIRFSSSYGGVLCERCQTDDAIEISRGTLMVMRRILKSPLYTIKRIHLGRRIEEELKIASDSYLNPHLSYPLKSLKVLEVLVD
ncbi:TPA: DNA repair protein RecO [bacterium]|nr:DNA repair protein RecO [bacterium]